MKAAMTNYRTKWERTPQAARTTQEKENIVFDTKGTRQALRKGNKIAT